MMAIGALLITYFVSQLVWRMPFPKEGLSAVLLVHALSLAAICVVIVALRYPATVFAMSQLVKYALAQGAWFLLDFYRRDGFVTRPRG
jgi:hypothetical protein